MNPEDQINVTAPLDRLMRRRTMKFSAVEGGFALVTLGLQVAFYLPFLNALNADTLQISLGVSLPGLVTGMVQLFSPAAYRIIKNHKYFCLITCILHSVCFLPLAFISFWPPKEPVWPAIIFGCIAAIPFGLQIPVWADWISRIVPRKRRGRYFGLRAQILTGIQFATTMIAGYLLYKSQKSSMTTFGWIWFVAFAARASSSILFLFHYESSAMRKFSGVRYKIIEFIKSLHSTMFGRYALGISLLNLCVNFSLPFYTIHMLNNLQFDYYQYTLIINAPILALILTVRLWGRLSDRIGYVVPLRVCLLVITASPLVWTSITQFNLLLINQLIVGVAWAGFNMIAFNYSISAVDSDRRAGSIAYLNVMNFFCVFAGATLSGLVGDRMPQIFSFQSQSVFLVTAIGLIIPIVIFSTLRDVERHVGPLTPMERFFFDPRISIRSTPWRSFLGIKRPF